MVRTGGMESKNTEGRNLTRVKKDGPGVVCLYPGFSKKLPESIFLLKEANTWSAWNYSKKNEIFIPVEEGSNKPLPGDMFLMQYKENNGHVLIIG